MDTNLQKHSFKWTGLSKKQVDTIENILFDRGHITVLELKSILGAKEEEQKVERERQNKPTGTAKKTHKV
ncbi:MAG: hypothetical protein RR839_00575 [Oscillospiraceae bacterium]